MTVPMPRILVFLFALVSLYGAGSVEGAAALKPEQLAFFESRIRPVLAERCYQCHSAEAKELKAGLFLDTRAGIRKGGESGAALIPGDSKSSLLLKAIGYESKDLQMPPKSKLSPQQIADFRKWIEMGAPDPRDGEVLIRTADSVDIGAAKNFWAFEPLKEPVPPQVENKKRVRTAVDRFVLEKLESRKMNPNSEASRMTLIRRAYFGLWGLPPSEEEVKAFVDDESPYAYEQLIDRLLSGQHYGERWARHWLDLARFAESNGYAFDKDRNAAYHYRDFVIKALNNDMPYDEFVQLQIAGDQLKPGQYMGHAATGFIASGPFTSQQTEKERERSRYEQLDDIIATLGTATLGLTLGCARCHDHKYDPVSMGDYYRMIAVFAETGFDDYQLDQNPEKTKREKKLFETAHKKYVQDREAYEKNQLQVSLASWLANRPRDVVRPKLSPWHTVGPFGASSFDEAYATAFAPERMIDLDQPVGDDKRRWVEQPGWKDSTIHNVFSGDNAAHYLFRTIEVADEHSVEVSIGRDDAVKLFLNGAEILGNKTTGGVAADQDKAVLNLRKGTNELLMKIVNASGPSGFYFRLLDDGPPENIQVIIDLAAEERTEDQNSELLKWYAPRDPEWKKLESAEKEHKGKEPKPDLMPIFAARKGGTTYNFGANTRKVFFLTRGNSNQKQGQASPGFSRVLMNTENNEKHWSENVSNGATNALPPRVAMAKWLTDERHGAGHLLARVIVNRLWQHHFGQGIVRTPSDFGSQGERPSHPELLDYLASELVSNGWRLKPIQKLIMTSAVYMQGGETQEVGARLDPENRLLWRRPSLRLEAEAIRDALLNVSGTLDKKMFGPGSLSENDRRRSVYLKVKRSNLISILQLFDAPDAMQSIGMRNETTVPSQALAMMNSGYVRQVATSLAKRVFPDESASLSDVVRKAYWLTLSRPPQEKEIEKMEAFITRQSQSYGTDSGLNEKAIIDFCQLMLCLNEFVFVD